MTAPSTAAALRDLIAGLGIGGAHRWTVALGRVKPGDQVPYILVMPLPIGSLREPMGDYGDQARMDDGVTELIQVDVVQRIRTADWTPEDPTAIDTILTAVNGARLPLAPHHVYGVTADGMARLDDLATNLARTAITVRVRRSLKRSA